MSKTCVKEVRNCFVISDKEKIDKLQLHNSANWSSRSVSSSTFVMYHLSRIRTLFAHAFVQECNICYLFISVYIHSPNSDYRISSAKLRVAMLSWLRLYASRRVARDWDLNKGWTDQVLSMLNRLHSLKINNNKSVLIFSLRALRNIAMQNLKSLILIMSSIRPEEKCMVCFFNNRWLLILTSRPVLVLLATLHVT